MTVLITGVNGLLGKDIARVMHEKGKFTVIGTGRAECKNADIDYVKMDLLDTARLERVLADVAPEVVIHCAAYTKLDDCEKNNEYAYQMNVEVTKHLATHAKRFVYISSDAVFSGKSGNYIETDPSDAINYYGYTKYMGEKMAELCDNHLIIRSSIYGYNLNNNQSIAEWGIKNLKEGRQINGFSDVMFNPLYSVQLADILLNLIQQGCTGVYHLGAKQTVSKYEFFKLCAQAIGADESLVNPTSVDEMDFFAKRTKNTSLCIKKAAAYMNDQNDIVIGISQMIQDMNFTHREYKEC